MQNPADHPGLTAKLAKDLVQQFVDRSKNTSGFAILWQQSPGTTEAPCITFGFPGLSSERQHTAGLNRLICWPLGLCQRHRVGIISSRMSAKKHTIGWWYDLLRTAVLRVATDTECVVATQGTATYEPLTRTAMLFGVPLVDIGINETTVTADELARWLVTHGVPSAETTPDVWHAQVAPALTHETSNVNETSIPERDQLGVTQTQRCCVLQCRDQGNLHRLLIKQLRDVRTTDLHILAAQTPQMPAKVQAELYEAGAIPWLVDGLQSIESPTWKTTTCNQPDELVDGPLEQPQDWLCHWTRPREGAWPGESTIDYLDELILGCETADRSALASLMRILDCRRLLAAHLRGEHSAVSFTEVPLSEFRERRVYRRHKRHYDFEPWGIGVLKNSLAAAGAKPVRYGSSDDASATDLWFQPATDAANTIDWTAEKEWRLPRQLELDELPVDSVCVFVNELREVDSVRSICNWPVLVVP